MNDLKLEDNQIKYNNIKIKYTIYKFLYMNDKNIKKETATNFNTGNNSEGDDDGESETEDNPYKIKALKNNKTDLYQPECAENDIVPKLPFGALITGKSGSGKTNAIVHLLSTDGLLKDQFDYVYLFTAIKPDDDLIKPLNIDESCIFENFTENDVKKIMDKLEAYIKVNGFKKCPSVLMLFDDILSNKDFLKSKTLTKLAVANRHMNITYFILSQYYKRMPPVVRTNVKLLLFFPACLSEVEKMAEEMAPPNMSKKQFIKIAQHATKEQYNFLTINNTSKDRLRKNFDIILSL
jgi:hypothetical protein